MKKFILFLFLLTSIAAPRANSQDLSDEFTDPSLDVSEGSTTSSDGFESSTSSGFEKNFEANTEESFSNESLFAQPQQTTETQGQSQSFSFGEETQENSLSLDGSEYSGNKTGDVVVEQQTNLYQSYRQRRGHHGVLFSVNYEKFYPVDYYSMYRDKYIEEFLDSSDSIDLIGLEIGYKYNFKLGSVAILANYAQGSKSNSSYNGDSAGARERNLSISRYGISVNYAADNILEEPWIVPYGQIGVHQFQVVEDDLSTAEAMETTTQISFNYKIGLLFQLNWIEKSIDPNTHIDGLRSSGLQNTFIDIFATTHVSSSEAYDPANSNSEGDPDMGTGMDFGIGLKMEF